ncbi:unnamed protein product [Acanthosepion pharaonis]|uniref:Uncharacterized protein n=1 Tax=Acanthosepion pharaonis TaxID=158019 RepID=A0A812C4Y2_ACAPH|nr:unnamed protein product [Sepia pharaonis]
MGAAARAKPEQQPNRVCATFGSTGLSPPAIAFFSTFPHGTCRLSDLSRYLALDGAYHPIWAAFPSNPTLGSKADARRPHRIGLAPAAGGPDRGNSELRVTKTSGCLRPMRHMSRSLLLATGFGVGLLPVHSPLLRESRLVSFPPLSDMLKFSGSSRPSRGRRCLR